MSRVFWDSNLFIYLFEQHPQFSAGVKSLLARMEARGDQLFTSTLSVGEVLAKPYEFGDMARCSAYEKAMQQAAVNASSPVLLAADQIRSEQGRLPDLASAAQCGK